MIHLVLGILFALMVAGCIADIGPGGVEVTPYLGDPYYDHPHPFYGRGPYRHYRD